MKCPAYEKCKVCGGCVNKEYDFVDMDCKRCIIPACNCDEKREDEDGIH